MEAAQPPESFRDGLIAAAELRLCEHMHGKLKATIFLHYVHDDSDDSGIRNQIFWVASHSFGKK